MPEPKTTLDTSKNVAISSRITKMESIKKRHDESVKELYHLELFQNMLDYKPEVFINDVRYSKVNMQRYKRKHQVLIHLFTLVYARL